VSLHALFWHLKLAFDHLFRALCLVVSSPQFPLVAAFSRLPTLGGKLVFSLNDTVPFLARKCLCNESVRKRDENDQLQRNDGRGRDASCLVDHVLVLTAHISLSDLSPTYSG